MMLRDIFAPALLAVGLAGCSLAPAYHRPATPTPATVANSYGAVETPTRMASWRAFFTDPRLQQVIEQALAHNRDLAAAVANVQISRAEWLSQRAALFPSLSGQASANGSQTPASVLGLPGVSGSYTERIYAAELSVPAYEVDLFGRVRSRTKAAQEQYLASAAARDAAQISLVGQVAQAWLTLGSDRSLLAVAKDTQDETSASLALTQAKFDHGEAAQSDVDQAKGLAAQASFNVARYATQVAQDKDALDLLVGAPTSDALLPAGVDSTGVMGQLPTGIVSAVLLDRPDVMEAEDQLKGANANIGAARAAFFPDIMLTGTGGVTSTALSSLFRPGSGEWSYAAQLTQPIFDAGKNRAGLLQAKAQRDLAQANYEKAIQTAFREVADALAQRANIDAELTAQQAQVDADADAARLIKAEYARGAASELDVFTAQSTLYAAENTLVSTRLLQSSNLVALYQALGGGLS
ncbi:MAG TPA: efflux transporter outer membrane subunit [Caulobacteraceae bacterium]|nr:efflux transporter outer membrane subunit [Caulobacteraceae bacterium]